jgi:hypothetical protein
VSRLVLLGGYYYPSARVDALLTAPVALPLLGDVMRYTVTALSARLMLDGMVEAMFAPREVPGGYQTTLSREMLVRPVQLRANAEDAAFMIGQAKASSERHHELQMPVAIFAGGEGVGAGAGACANNEAEVESNSAASAILMGLSRKSERLY